MAYDIGIPEITCTNKSYDVYDVSIRFDSEANTRPSVCPHCGYNGNLHIHSTSHNLIKDTKTEGKICYIYLKIRIYRCPECKRTCQDTFTFFDMHAHMTYRLRNEFVRRCIDGDSFTHIASDYRVDPKTVSAAFNRYITDHMDLFENAYTPEALGIDEVHIDGKMRLVLTDIKGQKLLDMRRDNKTRTVTAYLRTLDPSVCKCAAMDFAPGYASAVQSVLPETTIVVDHFHVIQELNRCVDNIRKDVQNKYANNKKARSRFKKSRLLFMTNFENLTDSAQDSMEQFGKEYPDLYRAYFAKEIFRDIYAIADGKDTAGKLFDVWITSVPDWERFRAMKNTFAKRRDHILNYWDWNLTNAYTESVNNRIKAINKSGRGYSFDILRKRCILAVNREPKPSFNPRTSVYKSAEEISDGLLAESPAPYGTNTDNESKYSLAIECYKSAMQSGLDIRRMKRLAAYAALIMQDTKKGAVKKVL